MCDGDRRRLLILLYGSCHAAGIIPAKSLVHRVFFPQTKVTERNKTVRPVKSNITFTEDIYFDRISRTQLDQLLMILNMSSEEKRGYKLGSGKPLGLGSITMNVTGCNIRMIELDEESKSIVYGS